MGKRDKLLAWVSESTVNVPKDHMEVWEAWKNEAAKKVDASEVIGACLLRQGNWTGDRARKGYATMLVALRVMGKPNKLSPAGLSKFLTKALADNPKEKEAPRELYDYLIAYGDAHANPFDTLYDLDVAVWVRYSKAMRRTLSAHFEQHNSGLVDLDVLNKAMQQTCFRDINIAEAVQAHGPYQSVAFAGNPDTAAVEMHNMTVQTSVGFWKNNLPVELCVGVINRALGATAAGMTLDDVAAEDLPARMAMRDNFLKFSTKELPAALKKLASKPRNHKALLRTVVRFAGWSATQQGMTHTHVMCRRCKRLALSIDQHGVPYDPGDAEPAYYCANCKATHAEFDRTSLKLAASQMEVDFAGERNRMLAEIYAREEALLASGATRVKAIDYAKTVGEEGVVDGDAIPASPTVSPMTSPTRSPAVKALSASEVSPRCELLSDATLSPGLTNTPLTAGGSPPARMILTPEKPRNPFSKKKDPRPPRPPAAAEGLKSPRKEMNNLLKCGHCARPMLSMDENGEPLSLEAPRGGQYPIQCPGCGVTSRNWIPFNFYEHVVEFEAAIRAERKKNPFPPKVTRQTPTPDRFRFRTGTPSTGASTPYPGQADTPDNAPPPLIICGRCQRPQLRIDQAGLPLPLDRTTAGVLPLECPGCGELHGDWKPFPLPAYAVSADGVGGAFSA